MGIWNSDSLSSATLNLPSMLGFWKAWTLCTVHRPDIRTLRIYCQAPLGMMTLEFMIPTMKKNQMMMEKKKKKQKEGKLLKTSLTLRRNAILPSTCNKTVSYFFTQSIFAYLFHSTQQYFSVLNWFLQETSEMCRQKWTGNTIRNP